MFDLEGWSSKRCRYVQRAFSLGVLLSVTFLSVHSILLQSTRAVVFTDAKASRYPYLSTQNNCSHSIVVNAVLTATWVSEREENARRICNLAEDGLGVPCHMVNATKLDMHGDALDEIRTVTSNTFKITLEPRKTPRKPTLHIFGGCCFTHGLRTRTLFLTGVVVACIRWMGKGLRKLSSEA